MGRQLLEHGCRHLHGSRQRRPPAGTATGSPPNRLLPNRKQRTASPHSSLTLHHALQALLLVLAPLVPPQEGLGVQALQAGQGRQAGRAGRQPPGMGGQQRSGSADGRSGSRAQEKGQEGADPGCCVPPTAGCPGAASKPPPKGFTPPGLNQH